MIGSDVHQSARAELAIGLNGRSVGVRGCQAVEDFFVYEEGFPVAVALEMKYWSRQRCHDVRLWGKGNNRVLPEAEVPAAAIHEHHGVRFAVIVDVEGAFFESRTVAAVAENNTAGRVPKLGCTCQFRHGARHPGDGKHKPVPECLSTGWNRLGSIADQVFPGLCIGCYSPENEAEDQKAFFH